MIKMNSLMSVLSRRPLTASYCQSFFVASMRHDFLQRGIRQIGLQFVLQSGLAFRSGKLGQKFNVPRVKRIFPGFSFAQKKRSAVSQAKWR
jgi:hypothetical protein